MLAAGAGAAGLAGVSVRHSPLAGDSGVTDSRRACGASSDGNAPRKRMPLSVGSMIEDGLGMLPGVL